MSLAWVLAAVPVLACLSLAHGLEDQALCAGVSPASGTSGTIDKVAGLRNTIGYAGLDAVIERQAEEEEGASCRIKMARMVNKFGAIVSPSTDTAQAAVRANTNTLRASSDCAGFGLCAEIMDAGDSDVWPITTLTYFVVGLNNTDAEHGCNKMKSVYDYTKWILTSQGAADIASSLQFAAMPHSVSSAALEVLDEMNCTMGDGTVKRVKDMTTSATSIQGAGSSLQAALQTKLTNQYNLDTSIQVTYESTGSGTGKSRMTENVVDFAGSDSLIATTNPKVIARQQRMIPVFAAAVCIMYNNKDVEDLVLSRKAVDDIFTGRITSWSNPEIMASNPGKAWPNDAMVRVVRSDKSGTTETITRTLYNFAGLPNPPVYSDHVLEGSSDPAWPSASVPFQDGAQCTYKNCTKAVCSPGYYLDPTEDTCAECGMGTFSSTRGQQTSCTDCPPGTYTNTRGNTKCSKCDESKYQDSHGQDACKPCPASTRRFFLRREVVSGNSTVIVSDETPGESIDECMCLKGSWLPESLDNSTRGGLPCVSCPEGASCEGFNGVVQTLPSPKQGYWGDPLSPNRFIECKPGACKGNYECEDGHVGRLCASAADHYFVIGDTWYLPCPDGEGSVRSGAITFFGVAAVLAIQISINALSSSVYDAFSSIMTFLQITGLITRFSLRWHPNLTYVNIIMSIVNFDVDFLAPQCLLTAWDQATVYFVQLAIPGFIACGLCIQWQIAEYFKRRKQARRVGAETEGEQSTNVLEKPMLKKLVLRWSSHRSDNMMTFVKTRTSQFVNLMFHILAYRALSVFRCEPEPDGKTQFMTFAPEIDCGSPLHSVMVATSVVYIIFVIIGFPTWTTSDILRSARNGTLNSAAFIEKFGFLYTKYDLEHCWWEVLNLGRRFLLVLILVFVRIPMMQGALSVVVLSIMLTLQLSEFPFTNDRIDFLETFGMCCAMAYAVSGMLFFPSLDNSVSCVGSENLEGHLSDECYQNLFVKNITSVVMLIGVCSTLILAMYITYKDFEEQVMSAKAAKKIEFDKQWYGKDKSSKMASRRNSKTFLSRQSLSGSRRGSFNRSRSLDNKPSKTEEELRIEKEGNEYNNLLRDVQMLVAQQQVSEPKGWLGNWGGGNANGVGADGEEITAFSDPYTLHLCDMLNGYYLHDWHKSISSLSEKEFAVRLMFGSEETASMRQEIAYISLEGMPRFATEEDAVSGYFSKDVFATTVRDLGANLPGLMDFLGNCDQATLANFTRVLKSYVHSRKRPGFGRMDSLLRQEYHSPVVHWLLTCSEEHRQLLRCCLHGIVDAVDAAAANSAQTKMTKAILKAVASRKGEGLRKRSNKVENDVTLKEEA